MVAGHDLAGAAGPAVVEQDEVLDEIEQPILRQHAVEKSFGVEASLVLLRVALPLDEVFPVARDRAVAGCIAVAHHQEGVVVEGVSDAVLGEVVGKVVVEPGADVPIDRLQLDEDQRQAVDETHQVRAPVVVRHAHALDLQLAHGQEAVVRDVAEVDHLRVRVARLAGGIAPLHRHPAADEAVELAVVLDERAGEIDARQLLDGLLPGRLRDVRVQPRERGAQVANQHDVPLRRATERAVRPEGLRLVGVDALPAEHLFEMLGEGLLDQPVFAVDVAEGHALSARLRLRGSRLRGRLAIFDQLAVAHHHHGGASLPRNLPGTPAARSNAAGAACMSASGRRETGCSFMG